MKKDCAKMKEMKVRNFHKPEVFNRLNKKVVGTFSIAIVLIATASIMGIILSNNSFAATNRFKKGKPLTKFDRIMYWPDGVMGDIECNLSLPATSPPKCYQPIPQEYALGFINNEKTIERAARNINIEGGKAKEKTGIQADFLGKRSTKISGKRSPLKFIDLFNGASYMGNLYDVRVYAYGSANVRTFKNSVIEHYHTGGEYVASEWHFYPRNTLKALDELYYSDEEDIVESEGDDPKDSCTDIKEKDPTDPKGKKTITVGQRCTYDKNAYRDASGNIIYTGVFREGSNYGPVRYTAAEMEAYLENKENSVRLLGVGGSGTFKGTVAFMDIDGWGGERYAAASGVDSVFTTWNSEEYADRAKENGKSGKMVYDNSYFKQMNFCQDPTPDKACYYAWGGSTEEGKTTRETARLWFNFSSSSTTPFALIYSGSGHGSMIESSQFYITHVLMDDLAEIPEGIIASAQNFQRDFESLYGHTLENDKNFPVDWKSETDRVLRFFPIYQYAGYTPYTMNELLKEVSDIELKWYSCPQMTDDCLVPYDPEHDNGKEIVGGEEYFNGYDFIDGNKVYYASMGDPLEVNFPNTCYSDNTSTKEINNVE